MDPMRWPPRGVLLDLSKGLVPLLVMAATLRWALELPPGFFADVVGLYALLAALVIQFLPAGAARSENLGAANRVTLLRATLLLPVCALVLSPAPVTNVACWWIIGASTGAMALDGVDGAVARRTGGATRFGARFDMELDAFLMLALAALVWRSGQTGPWVLFIGALRYLFVAAGRIWPVLAGDLPPRFRRKLVCVIQGVALLVCLGPIIPPDVASTVAATALALLLYSFAVDVRWLLAHAAAAPVPDRA